MIAIYVLRERIAERRERVRQRFRIQRRHCHLDVDDILGGQVRDRG
jgi:hypothetical protein